MRDARSSQLDSVAKDQGCYLEVSSQGSCNSAWRLFYPRDGLRSLNV